jgi:hypothetical protein
VRRIGRRDKYSLDLDSTKDLRNILKMLEFI